ncbi:hypothetical protein NliqN6_1983 [Naganishia liquefaciens]|uniref:TATA box binding protein associated factor (TAF) histone-like fold domain-containing protein n=1 Tax=Naganishia liquefaciens TaxID=104408 RepID=A0A8H3TRE9_9TREE|nr:hypothetical protein NliqN6_1983 [Naganishia liquefaciens]
MQYPADYAIGIYPATTVKDVAESLAIDEIDDDTCRAIAGDVEYRINQVIGQAQKFMRHAKRTTMMPQDIEHALQALNVQPLLHPPYPLHKPSFVPVYTDGTASSSSTQPPSSSSAQPQLYFLRDEEIDLVSYLRGVHPAAASTTIHGRNIGLGGAARRGKNAGVRWRAHWLAVEGVQPLIKENPISQIQETGTVAAPPVVASSSATAAAVAAAPTAAHASAARKRKLQASMAAAKTHLSQELLLFFTRITDALIPNPAAAVIRPTGEAASSAAAAAAPPPQEVEMSDAERSRTAALATLLTDPSLSDLLPYLVRWLSEMIMVSISGGTEGRTTAELGYLLDGMQALIANPALFIEPYLHQMLPPIMSILLSVPLGNAPAPSLTASTTSTYALRQKASDMLGTLMKTYGPDYETLIPRVTQTLQKALASPASFKSTTPTGILATRQVVSSHGRYQGALLGLSKISSQALLRSLLGGEARGLKALGEQLESAPLTERESIVQLTMDLLRQNLAKDESENAIEVDLDEDVMVERYGRVFGRALVNAPRIASDIDRYLKQDV